MSETDNAPKIGERYSLNYLRPTEILSDSVRFRRRVGEIMKSYTDFEFHDFVRRETGEEITNPTSSKWQNFITQCPLPLAFDLITLAYRYYRQNARTHLDADDSLKRYVAEIARIMREEAIGYRVDQRGGVHHLIDEHFEREKLSTLSGLGSSRYEAVRSAYDEGLRALELATPKGRQAVREVFNACENLFKLLCPRAPRLGKAELRDHLKPIIDRQYAADVVAMRATGQLLTAFQAWVEGAHHYRHEPGTEAVQEPPLDIAVLLFSQGASFLRWLVEIDHRAQA